MGRSKLKLSLLEDYIKLSQSKNLFIVNVCDDGKYLRFLKITDELLSVYEKVIFKLGLMDLSFLLLKKDLDNFNADNQFFNVEIGINCVQKILENFNFKLKKLSLNDIEMNYLTKNIKNLLKNS